MNQRKHLFSPQEAPVFRRRIGPELNDLHIFRIIFIYLLPQMPSRSPKGEAPARVARRKARPRATSDAFRPILPPAETRAGNNNLKLAARGPVDWRLDDSGRVWFALSTSTPRTLHADKVLELEFGLKTPQPPALPDAAPRRARGPKLALKLRAHGETN